MITVIACTIFSLILFFCVLGVVLEVCREDEKYRGLTDEEMMDMINREEAERKKREEEVIVRDRRRQRILGRNIEILSETKLMTITWKCKYCGIDNDGEVKQCAYCGSPRRV